MAISACSNCSSKRLYKSRKPVSPGGGDGGTFLPGLGTFWVPPKVDVVICQDCGLTRLFASQESLEKLTTSSKWMRV
jgi:DNA-directed RNA polymerase subunit RPC12/RpoP